MEAAVSLQSTVEEDKGKGKKRQKITQRGAQEREETGFAGTPC
jgi:hypothetical protein